MPQEYRQDSGSYRIWREDRLTGTRLSAMRVSSSVAWESWGAIPMQRFFLTGLPQRLKVAAVLSLTILIILLDGTVIMLRTTSLTVRVGSLAALALVGVLIPWILLRHRHMVVRKLSLVPDEVEPAGAGQLLSTMRLRCEGGPMKFSIYELLRNHLHLSRAEIEDYIVGLLDDEARALVTRHIKACSVCGHEVNLIQSALRDLDDDISEEPDAGGELVPPHALPVYEWPQDATLWINDSHYKLSPNPHVRSIALVEGLTLDCLRQRKEADIQLPGTCIASIEGERIREVFPLYKFANYAVMAATAGSHSTLPVNITFTRHDGSCITAERKFQYRSDKICVVVYADHTGAVFLSAHPPSA